MKDFDDQFMRQTDDVLSRARNRPVVYAEQIRAAASYHPDSSDEVQDSFGNDSLENISIRTLSPDAWSEEAEALLIEAVSDAGAANGTDAGINSTVEYNLLSCENGEIRMIRSSCPESYRPSSGTAFLLILFYHGRTYVPTSSF